VLDLGLLALLACVGAVVVGALVQGTVGFGIALVAAPVLLMVDPRLVPPAMLVVSSAMPWTTLAQEWRHIDWHGLRWSLAGRVVGTLAGVWVVGSLGADGVGLAIAVMVLLAVGVSVSGLHLPLNRRNLVVAGALGGAGGTASGIGGPPLAVLYSGESGPAIRATLAAFFAVGQALSLVALLGAGVVDGRAALTGLALLPGVLVGAVLARRLRRYLHPRLLRPAVLGLATVSAVVLVVRVVL
jgi:hypothetical protein